MDVHITMIVYHFLILAFFKVADCSEVSIVGGKDVKKLHSWMVSIQKNRQHVCGGLLIKNQWVLTAAHCKEEPINSVTVLIGSLSLSQTKGSQRVEILRYERPTTYNRQTKQDDIMLIKLKQKVKAKPKTIPKKEQAIQPETKCLVTGWGTTNKTLWQASDKLQELEVTIVERNKCNRDYEDDPVITKDMLCAGNKGVNRGTCMGDSGGPLVCKKNIVGVLSGARGCGDPKKPSVFTFLSKRHILWINNILKKQFNSTKV